MTKSAASFSKSAKMRARKMKGAKVLKEPDINRVIINDILFVKIP